MDTKKLVIVVTQEKNGGTTKTTVDYVGSRTLEMVLKKRFVQEICDELLSRG